MSNFAFVNPFGNEVYVINKSNSTIDIQWTGGPANPIAQNVSLSLVDLGPTKNPNPYGQVVLAIAGKITQPSAGVGQCTWAVPLTFAFNQDHYYVISIENAPAPVTNWAYSKPFNIFLGDTVSAPSAGLGSNSNYILCSGCGSLTDVSVTIDVAQDIIGQSASGTTTGFGFQLNAYSPKNEKSAWQQYVMAVFGTEIVGAVDNWPVTGNNIINSFFNLTTTPNNKIPAGYTLKIILQNDNNGNVTGALYVVIDNNGKTLANVTTALTSITGVNSTDLAPIVAFELNLVGPVNGESAVLSSGAGTILYSASTILTVLNSEPACTESGYITAETANSFYGELPAAPSNGFIQTFSVKPGVLAPMIRKQGKPRSGLIYPASQAS